MYASKMLMELAPNIHLLGVFTIAFTVVYRKKALYPIYIYVLLNGIFSGFSAWWLPYLYIWTILWLNMQGTLAWIAAGLPFDFIHGVSNFFCGILIMPVISAINIAEKNIP